MTSSWSWNHCIPVLLHYSALSSSRTYLNMDPNDIVSGLFLLHCSVVTSTAGLSCRMSPVKEDWIAVSRPDEFHWVWKPAAAVLNSLSLLMCNKVLHSARSAGPHLVTSRTSESKSEIMDNLDNQEHILSLEYMTLCHFHWLSLGLDLSYLKYISSVGHNAVAAWLSSLSRPRAAAVSHQLSFLASDWLTAAQSWPLIGQFWLVRSKQRVRGRLCQ